MAEEMNINQEQTTQEPDYIDQIEQLRANSVSKTEYDKLKTDYNRAMNALINGGQLAAQEEEPIDKDKLRKELGYYGDGCSLSNLDYWTKTLQLRKAIMDEGGRDPFLPYGQKIAPTAEDIEKANDVAAGIQELIEYADGDSGIFTNEFQRRVVDTVAAPRRRR